MKKLINELKKARFVFVCGNGGSAATAEHFTNDLFSKGIRAICLNSNTSIMTMIANDFGYEQVFSKQLELYANFSDLLIVISASGNSDNIVDALEVANCTSFALLGMDGGRAKYIADHKIMIKSKDYGKIEDEHMKIVHKVKDLL